MTGFLESLTNLIFPIFGLGFVGIMVWAIRAMGANNRGFYDDGVPISKAAMRAWKDTGGSAETKKPGSFRHRARFEF